MKYWFVVALLVLTACSSSGEPAPAPSDPAASAPTSWLVIQPGDALNLEGPAGELTFIYVDESYTVDGTAVSAFTLEHDDAYVTDYFDETDGVLYWYGRRGDWRAGRGGETARQVPIVDGVAHFGDISITVSDDGPVEVETPDGVFAKVS